MSKWFEPNFCDTDEEDDELVLADECKCDSCGEMFTLPSGSDIDRCPLCGVKFDE